MIKFNNDAATDAAIKNDLMTSVVSRTLSVTIGGTLIPAENIVADSLNLKSSILSGSILNFGGCIPSQLTLHFLNLKNVISGDISEAAITVSIIIVYLDNGIEQTLTQQLFTGFVFSMKTLQKRAYSELIAFDEMYRMAQTKCKGAISGVMAYSQADISTLYRFARKTLELYDGKYNTDFVTQFEALGGGFQNELAPHLQINLSKTLFDKYASDDLTVLDLLKAHSELNARFAYIAADGSLKFTKFFSITGHHRDVVIKKPVDEVIQYFQDASCEDYDSAQVLYLSFAYNGNDAFIYRASDDKRFWYISDNIITKCIDDLSIMGRIITNFWQTDTQMNFIFYSLSQYKPFKLTTFGEFWLEPGDRVTVNLPTYNSQTKTYDNTAIDSFILNREIKGISNLKVNVSADGSKYLSKEVVAV